MVIVKKIKSPKDRLLEIEDYLQIGLENYIPKYFVKFIGKYFNKDLPTAAKKERFLMIRDVIRDLSMIIDMEYDDVRELLAYAQLRSEALEILKKEMVNEERATIAIGNSKYTMEDSLSLLNTVHKARKNISLAVNKDDLKLAMNNDITIM